MQSLTHSHTHTVAVKISNRGGLGYLPWLLQKQDVPISPGQFSMCVCVLHLLVHVLHACSCTCIHQLACCLPRFGRKKSSTHMKQWECFPLFVCTRFFFFFLIIPVSLRLGSARGSPPPFHPQTAVKDPTPNLPTAPHIPTHPTLPSASRQSTGPLGQGQSSHRDGLRTPQGSREGPARA